jgi:hypothetical protein
MTRAKRKIVQAKAPIGMIVGSVLLVLVGLLSWMPSMMSVMIFDAPGSTEKTHLWVIMLGAVTFPYLCFICTGLAWLFRHFKRPKLSLTMFFVPLLQLTIVVLTAVLFAK